MPGEPGKLGSASLEIPSPHWALWGQLFAMYAIKSGIDPDQSDEFFFEAKFWHTSIPDGATLTALRLEALPGDSAMQVPNDASLAINVDNILYQVAFEANDEGRLAMLRAGPFPAPSLQQALFISETIVRNVQRVAGRNNAVPLNVVYVRVRNEDRSKNLERFAMPYPVAPLSLLLDTRFPGIQPLLDSLADGRRLTDVFGRFLAFYKVAETYVSSVQPRLLKILHDAQIPAEKVQFNLPDDPFKSIAPGVVGMKWTQYLQMIKNDQLRNATAHLDPQAPLTPFDLSSEDRIRTASIVLHYIAAELCTRLVAMMEALAAVDPVKADELRFRHVASH